MAEKIKTPYESFGSTVRVEPGPARLKAVASPDLLDNAHTAQHYQVGLRDAGGRVIREGEEFDYLDWNGHNDANQDGVGRTTVFYLYQERTVPVLDASDNPIQGDDGQPAVEQRWIEVGVYKSREAANNAAEKLAGRE